MKKNKLKEKINKNRRRKKSICHFLRPETPRIRTKKNPPVLTDIVSGDFYA
jgi:hypothetical protein